ncbi:FtsW/RodA/SpoVE family cell cycle protein [Candidatus Beckwithbacteria bacterium]|nr:FtsW/RodA/SpoVE family cell cycle protein [Candidatus Beckwithbacteria bacterium]
MLIKLPDLWLMIPALLLCVLGLVVTYSISPGDFASQLQFFIVGLLLFLLLSLIDFTFLQAFSLVSFGLSFLLLLLTIGLAEAVRGSRRWLQVGAMRLQSSELMKPFLILGLSFLAAKVNVKKFPQFLLVLGVLALVCLLVFLQPDLGSMIVLLLIGVFVLMASYPKKRFFVALTILLMIAAPILWQSLASYQKQRVEHFLNPQADPLGASYNQIQAVIAAGSGQLFGQGLGKGTQSRLQYLPEKHTDFFFASLAEELGFLGSSLVLILFFSLGGRLLTLFSMSSDPVKRMVFLGTFAMFLFQASFHIGINLGLLPVTGITLPFLSVGGSSMLSSWLALGIASSASQSIRQDKAIYLR